MGNLEFLMDGLITALGFQNLLAAIVGAFLGLIVGAMPGIGSLAGVALLLPLTFKMDPTTAIIMLAALYYSNMYGGSFSAILLNIPGDSPAVMTSLDGYPMSRQGKAGKALFTASVSSFIGGTIGIIILTFLGPGLAKAGLSFGSPELTWLIILALTSIGWLLGDDPSGGLLATAIGILLATVGVDKALGIPRFSFNSVYLFSGISFIPLVIGMFGFGQVIDMVVNRGNYKNEEIKRLTIKESILDKSEFKKVAPVAARSGILGCFVGVLPGAGATMAAFLSYIMEKRMGKNKDEMGNGAIEGVTAAEAANNGAAMGAFAPLLSLGIPGSGTGAVLLGGLMMWGLNPGPMLFKDRPDFVWGLMGSMYIGNIICLIIAIACIPILMRVVSVPNSIMIPIISAVCIVGTYSVNNSMFDVGFMVGAGVIAYFMKIAKIPEAPLLLAFVLTPMLEMYVRQSFDMSAGSLSIFVGSTISIILMVCVIGFCFAPVIMKAIKKKQETVQ
ncbi:tripartite tricarboxylate transporter permease [Petroclostridium sp. X23]|uniref:tripartite tricarboxylate transporter permease n=1 Tax=Petroclostridium sp. X23 TaxID=3045146 RepID=UPI0024ACA595|nr:tripartite tricarboxylate transporter permease [Petroclostridium sp. X23]WHH60352.1 tripartite tricarboxylate transporter permease [Petroclostridium sp. X23]